MIGPRSWLTKFCPVIAQLHSSCDRRDAENFLMTLTAVGWYSIGPYSGREGAVESLTGTSDTLTGEDDQVDSFN